LQGDGVSGEATAYSVEGLTGWSGGRSKVPVAFANISGSSVWITIDRVVSEMPTGSIVVVHPNLSLTISATEPSDAVEGPAE